MIMFAVGHSVAVDIMGKVVGIFVITNDSHIGNVGGDRFDLSIEFIAEFAVFLQRIKPIAYAASLTIDLLYWDRTPCRLKERENERYQRIVKYWKEESYRHAKRRRILGVELVFEVGRAIGHLRCPYRRKRRKYIHFHRAAWALETWKLDSNRIRYRRDTLNWRSPIVRCMERSRYWLYSRPGDKFVSRTRWMYRLICFEPPSTNSVWVPLAEYSRLSPYSTIDMPTSSKVSHVTHILVGSPDIKWRSRVERLEFFAPPQGRICHHGIQCLFLFLREK